jgi:hypothetical protein
MERLGCQKTCIKWKYFRRKKKKKDESGLTIAMQLPL